MTDNEIIKALDWLERLKRDTDVSEWAESLEIILNEYNRQKAEIEKWRNAFMGECMLSACRRKKEIKDEAIKEFAERVKEYRNDCPMNGKEYICMDIQDVDNLVKEMKEVDE